MPPPLSDALAPSLRFLEAGGPVVWLLLVLSVVALTLTVLKLLQFRRARLGDTGPARRALLLYRGGRLAEALSLARSSPNPAAQVLAVALRGRRRRDIPENVVREEVARVGSELLLGLRGGLRPLELIGSLSPLLGLFGTVLGMIEAFRRLQEAGSRVDPAVLSGGIWEALLTTAVGLGVAIPVVAVLTWFERTLDRTAHQMEDVVTQAFTLELAVSPAEDDSHGDDGQAPERAVR